MKFILGKKIEMTQIFTEEGRAVAVTKVAAGPCTVVQVKNQDKDGYSAIQFGYGLKKEKNTVKPQKGHCKGLENFRYLKELRIKEGEDVKALRGQNVSVGSFSVGDKVNVTSTSKGRGFQGVVKRHGFHGGPASHGHKDQLRMPGSVGAKGPAHVFKGTRMGGRMGDDCVTITNLEIAEVDEKNNVLLIKGGIPGARNGLVTIVGAGEMVFVSSEKEIVNSEKEANVEEKQTDDAKEEVKSEEKYNSEQKKIAGSEEGMKNEELNNKEQSKEEQADPVVKKDDFDKK